MAQGLGTGPCEIDGFTGETQTDTGVGNMFTTGRGIAVSAHCSTGYGSTGSSMASLLRTFTGPIIGNNPITLWILWICSALAVTTSLATAPTAWAELTVVLCLSSGIISLIRHHIPPIIRLIVPIITIEPLMIVIDEFLRAFAFEKSRFLSILVGLIVTNCLVLGCSESFMMHSPPPSVLDGLRKRLG